MKKTTTLQIRINQEDKKEFEKICENLGITSSTAINIFIKKVINNKEIPFKLSYTLEFDKNDVY